MNNEQLSSQELKWIEDYCNQTITPEDFQRFEEALEASPTLRAYTRQYLALDSNLRQGEESIAEISSAWSPKRESKKVAAFPNWIPIAAAAAVAFTIGLLSNSMLKTEPLNPIAASDSPLQEVKAKGYAVVHSLFDTSEESSANFRSGDVLGADTISLASGSARIDFFSGAQIYIEGPATLEIRSAWEAEFHSGKLRANVPPAARGFVIESNGRRIIDLGTEFGVDTTDDNVHLEVFTGKVELEDRELLKGQAVSLTKDGQTNVVDTKPDSFSNLFAVSNSFANSTKQAFDNWQKHSQELSRDPRLIAYYPFTEKSEEQPDRVSSQSYPVDKELDGAVVMAEWADSRWGNLKSAMEFRRPGSRIRVNIPGEFEALTFSCWARIDSLDRKYSALFLSDSYQNGEPHWQIRNDGEMMIGFMVDETRPQPALETPEFMKTYEGPNAARNYNSPAFWDISMSGQWLHLASTYNPAERKVMHFVNGEKLSEQTIEDPYFIEKLRIGNAEIGNWGQPFRKDPEFAIRNLNGRIDELAIFNNALSPQEIQELFENGQSK